jgi:hypothetical protein
MKTLALALSLAFSAAASSATVETINVNPLVVLRDLKNKPVGINSNYLLDDDANRPAGSRSLASAFAATGSRFIRYPGGEKSDAYLWSVSPFDKARPTLARTGPYEWPSGDRTLVNSDGKTFKTNPLDFDEFMANCQQVGCVPVIVVAYDSMYKAKTQGGTIPTRAQLLKNAVEWVRYANVKKKFGIKYWEIGNESYINSYAGVATPANYGKDLIEFSKAMKAVDPAIKIGANGSGESWWKTVLPVASPYIDFLSVHDYPAWDFTKYDDYLAGRNMASEMAKTQSYIQAYAKAADRGRLTLALTEINAINWLENGWANTNDLGHALVAFDMIGQNLKTKAEFIQFWNSRWMRPEGGGSLVHDAYSDTNTLLPTGQALSAYKEFMLDSLVQTSGSTQVVSFASYSANAGKPVAMVALINKGYTEAPVKVALSSFPAITAVSAKVLKGSGPNDTQPVYVSRSGITVAGTEASLSLDPTSLTLLRFEGEGLVGAPVNLLANPGFEQQLASWTSWGNSQAVTDAAAGAYALRVGTGGGGMAQDLKALSPGKTYVFTAKGKRSNSSDWGWIGITFRDAAGNQIAAPSALISGGAYETVTLEFTAPASFATATAWAWKDPGTGYIFVDEANLYAR